MRALTRAAMLAGLFQLGCAAPPPAAVIGPVPQTLDAFKAAAAAILEEAHVPGAGIALVTTRGVEWAGGIGWADRDARRPVDADTLFRVGSVSKTFVAMALVQLYEDGRLDLDATVRSLLPELASDNRWEDVAPVRVRHLLEHTAGFDDMHFNEVYVLDDTPDRPLEQVLLVNPAARRVRWRPGTRMAYSNPGYAVAGRVIEAVTGRPFDDVIRERIFMPLDMTSSTFSGDVAALRLAQGHEAPEGAPVVRRRIHLRPAGALHSSSRDLAHFVEMLLQWGERGDGYVVDPEYLSNMEVPRTTVASTAGVRAGYGLGIYSTNDLPFAVLGHQGGIDGFLSAYGYSPSRDAGYVVLLNATYAPDTLRRLSTLAINYLKRELEPPPPAAMAGGGGDMARFVGYYHDASPRNALLQAIEYPLGGRTVRVRDGRLEVAPVLGPSERLIRVDEAIFRREGELAGSLAFADVDGRAVLVGASVYAERRPVWPLTVLRAFLATAIGLATLAPVVAVGHAWFARRRRAPTAWLLGVTWLMAVATLTALATAAAGASVVELAAPTARAWALFAASALYPFAALAVVVSTVREWRRGVPRVFGVFAVLIGAAHAGLAGYLGFWGLIGFRSWTY